MMKLLSNLDFIYEYYKNTHSWQTGELHPLIPKERRCRWIAITGAD